MRLGRAQTMRGTRLVSVRGGRRGAMLTTNNAGGLLTMLCADARFEVLGSPFSLLSVSLSASQNLYTRRGTLVSVAGKVENVRCRVHHAAWGIAREHVC